MFEDSLLTEFDASPNFPEVAIEASSEAAPELRPMSSKELASQYGVSDRTVQTWFKTVSAAYCWLESTALKTGTSNKIRYTPLCQQLIAEYRAVSDQMSEADWIASVHNVNAEKLVKPTPQASFTPVQQVQQQQQQRGGAIALTSDRLSALSGLIVPGQQAGDVVDLGIARLQHGNEILEVLEAEIEVLETEIQVEESELDLLEQAKRAQELKFAELQARREQAERRKHEIALKKAQMAGRAKVS